MADLDFRHNVQQVPAGAELPESVQRQVKTDISNIPDFQSAANNYGAATNWMSSVGSAVATRASTAIATKMGNEAGKNPQGDIYAFTDFDKTFAQSYTAQAHSTLGLQANQLITDANLEMAKSPRLSPDLIASTNRQVVIGLQNIFANAPTEIRPSLEAQYGSQQINLAEQATSRMIGEQREDMRSTNAYSSQVNAENAHSLTIAGKPKAAQAALDATIKSNQALVAAHIITPEMGKVSIDTVRKSLKSGQATYEYEIARSQGKGEEYLKNIADKANKGDPDYMDVTNSLMTYVNHQDALRAQDEQLRAIKMNVSIAKDVMGISGEQMQDFRENVSPVQYEKTQLAYIQARKAWQLDSDNQQDLIHHYSDPAVQARSSDKLKNKTFDTLVNKVMEQNDTPRSDAEVQVALSAGAPSPVFIKTLNDKLTSGSPANIEEAADQIQQIRDAEGGHALIGVSKQAQAIALQFQHQRGSMPDSDLARKITDNMVNIDNTMQTTLDNAWNLHLTASGAGGLGASKSLADFALDSVGVDKEDLGGAYFKTIYGNDIYDTFKSNFDAARGDYNVALQMTKDYVNQRYGETRINGGIQVSDSPIEKTLGYKDPDVVPFIQQDLLSHLDTVFKEHKNDNNDSWSIKPINTDTSGIRSTFRKVYPSAEIVRHVKTDKGEKLYSYPVNLIGRPGNHWDVVVQTPSGPRNLFLVAPNLGVITYKPNDVAIRKNYQDHIVNKGWFQ